MGKKVTNLKLKIQTGSDNTLVATWNIDANTTIVTPGSSGGIRVGDWVTVKPGSRWYNGVGIASFVFGQEWQVIQLNGARAVLGRNRSGSNNIVSPINVANLQGGSGSTSGSSTTVTNTVKDYTYTWFYDTGDGVWYIGESGTKEAPNNYMTYSIPSNAIRIHFHIIPNSKTREVNGQQTAYWTGELTIGEYLTSSNPPEVPPSPDVELDKYTLTATVDNVSDPRTDEIEFQIYDMTKVFATGKATVTACMASYKCNVNAGGQYRVRARAANIVGSGRVYSDWTDFTSPVSTIPSPPAAITTIRGASSTSVYLEWNTVNSAETYDIEYTTNVNYFDGADETTTVSDIEFNHYTVTGLESGDEYFFRVRAVTEQAESAWTKPKSVVIGKKPSAPTTWSSTTSVIVGDPLNLYWVHNSEDGSTETYAEVEITIGTDKQTYTVENVGWDDPDNEDKDKTKHYTIDTSKYKEGVQIKWRVRTAGITKQYGDWSVMRTVDIYARPTLDLQLTNQNGDVITTLQSFPFFIEGLAGPNTQEPIGYSVIITADIGYTTVDSVGRTQIVSAGDEVYSQYIDTNDPLLVEMTPANIDLENGATYTVAVTVSMNSGLTALATTPLAVSWTDEQVPIDAEIAYDPANYVCYVTPYSRDEETGELISGYKLSVYRREFDGTFTEIVTGLDSTKNTVITDPHPSLDYARYRIIAISDTTGAVSYYDPPGYPIGGNAVIIQWDEEWSDFEVTNTDERATPSWSGSVLLLPYNIDVAENNTPEATMVKYIGRRYPVSYYGTQIDGKASWNMEVPKSDKDTLYALRRLQIWSGDCYVREPSGSGFWANVTVSFSQKHNDLTIPVTLELTRVEGGM